jgi:hypothetical protein
MWHVKSRKEEVTSEVTELRTQGQTKHRRRFPEGPVTMYGSEKVKRYRMGGGGDGSWRI